MEKQGIVKPGVTPDIDKSLEKKARPLRPKEEIRRLDDDPVKRLAEVVAKKSQD